MHVPNVQKIPPHSGFGSLEDSKQSCLSLIPQPPKKDVMRMLENDGKILRYSARMVGMFNGVLYNGDLFYYRTPLIQKTRAEGSSLVTGSLTT